MSIGELADAAGISRRAVRFYVQRGLLPTPGGAGRGAHYGQEHLERLRKIQELQAGGYSLEAIGRVLLGQPVEPAPARPARKSRSVLSAELWTRVRMAEGLEIHFDTTRRNLSVEDLLAIREAVRSILGVSGEGDDGDGEE